MIGYGRRDAPFRAIPSTAAFVAVLLLALGRCPGSAAEDRMEPAPKEMEGVGIIEHLNAQIPLTLEFVDEDGNSVHLSDYFQGKRPVILNLVYFACPMLCTLVVNGVTQSMKEIPWRLGRDYENITVSIDPAETPALARAKKETYIAQYGHPENAAGWHFLTGKQADITTLAQVVGFKYRFVPETREFIHTAGTFICTPDGRLSRYLYGIQYEPQTVRMGLLEASQGKIGNTLDKLILTCYHYDSEAGRYGLVAIRIARLVGALSCLILGGSIFGLILHERKRKKRLLISGAVK